MTDLSVRFAFQRGLDDATAGRASAEFIFSSAQEHNDYILGFQQGVRNREQQQREQQKHTRRQRRTQPPAQGDLFGGEVRA